MPSTPAAAWSPPTSAFDACVELCRRSMASAASRWRTASMLRHSGLYFQPQCGCACRSRRRRPRPARVGHRRAELNASAGRLLRRSTSWPSSHRRRRAGGEGVGAGPSPWVLRASIRRRLLYLGKVALAEDRRADAIELLVAGSRGRARDRASASMAPTSAARSLWPPEDPAQRRAMLGEGGGHARSGLRRPQSPAVLP